MADCRLRKMGLDYTKASAMDVARIIDPRGGRIRRQIDAVKKILVPEGKRFVVYTEQEYVDGKPFPNGRDVYLSSYWQSENFFAESADLLRSMIKPAFGLNAVEQQWLDSVQDQMTVAIHVRRGDYLTQPAGSVALNNCSPEYYRNGFDFIRERVAGPLKVVVFSDDPEWVRSNFDVGHEFETFDMHGPLDAERSLWMMSRLKHNVIANSSFSWWSAWLNPNPDKVVVGPQKWYNRPDPLHDIRLPAGWNRV